jgi:hypothetical protein
LTLLMNASCMTMPSASSRTSSSSGQSLKCTVSRQGSVSLRLLVGWSVSSILVPLDAGSAPA